MDERIMGGGDNIRITLKEISWQVWNGLLSLMIRKSGGLL